VVYPAEPSPLSFSSSAYFRVPSSWCFASAFIPHLSSSVRRSATRICCGPSLIGGCRRPLLLVPYITFRERVRIYTPASPPLYHLCLPIVNLLKHLSYRICCLTIRRSKKQMTVSIRASTSSKSKGHLHQSYQLNRTTFLTQSSRCLDVPIVAKH
jgi:hypothetical protein